MVEVIEVVRRRMLSSIEEERPQRGYLRLVARGPSEGEQTKDRCGETCRVNLSLESSWPCGVEEAASWRASRSGLTLGRASSMLKLPTNSAEEIL